MRPLENLKKYDVILASNSPRRRELLADLGVKFRTNVLPGIDESFPADMQAKDVAAFISLKKAAAYRNTITSNELIITADTIVVTGDRIMGKPNDTTDAHNMLRELSGKTHQVITGVTIATKDGQSTFECVTDVDFANLSDDEIDFYVENFYPLDKAGAYGIQEWIGCAAVSSINGSFYNVMGLPVQRLYTELKKF